MLVEESERGFKLSGLYCQFSNLPLRQGELGIPGFTHGYSAKSFKELKREANARRGRPKTIIEYAIPYRFLRGTGEEHRRNIGGTLEEHRYKIAIRSL